MIKTTRVRIGKEEIPVIMILMSMIITIIKSCNHKMNIQNWSNRKKIVQIKVIYVQLIF